MTTRKDVERLGERVDHLDCKADCDCFECFQQAEENRASLKRLRKWIEKGEVK